MFDQAPRLAGVAQLPWHTVADLEAFQHRYMNVAFARPASETVTLIAEDETAARLGFVHAEHATDPVTQEACAYVTVLAVTDAAQGAGVAARLMAAVEDWARARKFRLICLDVFANNARARAFYAKQGYQDDSLRLTKPL
jgi:GNAT superfamily N-acetyltransferase